MNAFDKDEVQYQYKECTCVFNKYIISNEFDEKVKRAHMFLEWCTYVLGMVRIYSNEFDEKMKCAHMFLEKCTHVFE